MDSRASTPMRPKVLAQRLGMVTAKGKVTAKPIYVAIERLGLRHYRLGRAVYVTEADWIALLERNAVEPGERKVDPVRSERARRRAADAKRGRAAKGGAR